MSSWHSYPKIYAFGHREVRDIFDGPVVVEEKVDGSQFSFGVIDGELRCRSKGQEIVVGAPEALFRTAVANVVALAPKLTPEWTYRGEVLSKPKHNALAYDRVPAQNVILFDINDGEESYLSPEEKATEAERLGLECVPSFPLVTPVTESTLLGMLDRVSVLGGQKIEGIVVKRYDRFGADKKALMAKFVSEAFKEVHKGVWRDANPGKADVVSALITAHRTPARWDKAIHHLREKGLIQDSPRDIGALIAEINRDVEEECADDIKDALFKWAWPQIRRGVTAGFPEAYKEKLLALQFGGEA